MQGRPAEAAMWFFTVILGIVFAIVTVGLLGVTVGLGLHLYNVYEAAVWEGPGTLPSDPRVAGRIEMPELTNRKGSNPKANP